jgi:hypothetical protein
MKTVRVAIYVLACFGLLGPTWADVRTISPARTLPKPTNPSYTHFGVGVAIDGPHIIVLAINESSSGAHTYAALLYRRSSSTGAWSYRRTLVTRVGAFARMDVRMRNGIAAVQFGGNVSLFEYSGGDYVPATSAAPIRHPGGVAISGKSVLIGGDNCNYDGVIYQKGTNGVWSITGRLDDNAGECENDGLVVELNYDYALVRSSYGRTTAVWHRNGTAVDWIPSGVLTLPPDVGNSDKPYALQGATAVGNNGHVWRRSGTSTWTRQGKATSVDIDNGFGITFEAVYRDGVLVTSESGRWATPRAYVEASPGRFEHLATLATSDNATALDIAGRTVVAVARDSFASSWNVEVFTLPTPLRAPAPVVNDFEDLDASDFEVVRGQFAVASRGGNDVFAQGSTSVFAVALVEQSDWADYQRVEADVVPTFGAAGSWVGAVANYVDRNNYYYLAVYGDNSMKIARRLNGAETVLSQGIWYGARPGRITLTVDDGTVSAWINDSSYIYAFDRSLTRGRAGIATWRAQGDFDNVHAAATEPLVLFAREWGPWGSQIDVDLTTISGNWQVIVDEDDYTQGLAQLDTSGDALAVVGTPVANQEVIARARLDSYAASQEGAWFGLVARYVDPQNYYYVTARSTDQLQIRKKVNGVVTVLATVNFKAAPAPGQYIEYRFKVVNDQLHVYADNVLLLAAHDSDIPRGKYGLASYRTAATYEWLTVRQP